MLKGLEVQRSDVTFGGDIELFLGFQALIDRDTARRPARREERESPEDVAASLVALAAEVSAARQERDELRRRLERHALAAEASDDGIWDWDLETGRVHFSPRWKQILGYAEGDIAESPEDWLSRIHAGDAERVRTALALFLAGEGRLDVEYRMRRRSGGFAWVRSRAVASRRGDRVVRATGVLEDVTRFKELEERLRDEALHDPLTGLPNRAFLLQRLEELSARRPGGARFALLYLDVDSLKVVNDKLGHAMGDRMLQEIARRLRELARAEDVVARMSGDEFAILLDDIEPGDATLVADRVHRALAPPISLSGEEVLGAASVGIAMGGPGSSVERLLKEADAAMYRSKARRRDGFRRLWPAATRNLSG